MWLAIIRWVLKLLALSYILLLPTFHSKKTSCLASSLATRSTYVNRRDTDKAAFPTYSLPGKGFVLPEFLSPGYVRALVCGPALNAAYPLSRCQFRLVGTIYKTSIDVSGVIPGAHGKLNVSFGFYGHGIFDLNQELLNLSFEYSGEISGDINCLRGCNMPDELTGVVKVPLFHKLLTTPDGKTRIPEGLRFTITSNLEIPWSARLHAFTNFSTSFRQSYSIKTTVPQAPFVTKARLSDASVQVFPSSFRSPFALGELYASPVITILYRHPSIRIRYLLSVDIGLQLTIHSRRPAFFQAAGIPCSILQKSLRPKFKNASFILEATKNIGWPFQDLSRKYLLAGKALYERALHCDKITSL